MDYIKIPTMACPDFIWANGALYVCHSCVDMFIFCKMDAIKLYIFVNTNKQMPGYYIKYVKHRNN